MTSDLRWSVRVKDFDQIFPGDNEIHYVGSYGYMERTQDLVDLGLRKCYVEMFPHLLICLVDGEIAAAGGSECTNAGLYIEADVEIFYQDGAYMQDADLREGFYQHYANGRNPWDEIQKSGTGAGTALRDWRTWFDD